MMLLLSILLHDGTRNAYRGELSATTEAGSDSQSIINRGLPLQSSFPGGNTGLPF